MLQLIALFGVLIIFACGYGFTNPQGLLRLVDRFSGPAGYAVAVVVRVILGAAAILAAPESLSPAFLNVIGGLSLFAAAVLLVIGRARFNQLILWVAAWKVSVLRIWLLFGMLFGVALVWVTGMVQ